MNPVHQVDKPVIASVPVQNKKLLWETADINLYQQTLETLSEQNFSFWNQPECIQTLALLVPQAYIQAADIAVSSKQIKDINLKTVKCDRWRKAEIVARKATKNWILEGRPRNEDNDILKSQTQTQPIFIQLSTFKQ